MYDAQGTPGENTGVAKGPLADFTDSLADDNDSDREYDSLDCNEVPMAGFTIGVATSTPSRRQRQQPFANISNIERAQVV